MRVTKIRSMKTGKKLTEKQLAALVKAVRWTMVQAGYITGVEVKGPTELKIGLHMSSFRVNTAMHGHNGRRDRFPDQTVKGYKRTDVPTWDQRVDFNYLVNACFTRLGVQARIVSGNYTVRTEDGPRTNWPAGGDRAGNAYSADASDQILPEAEMRDLCDSDRREMEYKAAVKAKKQEAKRSAEDLGF